MKARIRKICSVKGGIIPAILIYSVIIVIFAVFGGYALSSSGKTTFFSMFIAVAIMGVVMVVGIQLTDRFLEKIPKGILFIVDLRNKIRK